MLFRSAKGLQVLAAQLRKPGVSKHVLGRVDLRRPKPREAVAARECISQMLDFAGRHVDDGSIDAAAKAFAQVNSIARVAHRGQPYIPLH